MRKILPSLIVLVLMLESVSAAAQQAPQSGARSHVTVSARIISGEAVRFGASAQKTAAAQRSKGKSSHIFPLARTRGEAVREGQSPVMLTEFH